MVLVIGPSVIRLYFSPEFPGRDCSGVKAQEAFPAQPLTSSAAHTAKSQPAAASPHEIPDILPPDTYKHARRAGPTVASTHPHPFPASAASLQLLPPTSPALSLPYADRVHSRHIRSGMIRRPSKLPPPPPSPPTVPPSPVASFSNAPTSSSLSLSRRVKTLPTPPTLPPPQHLTGNTLYSTPTRSHTMIDLAAPRKSKALSVKSASAAEIKLPSRPPPPVPTLPSRSPSAPALAPAAASESGPNSATSKTRPKTPATRPRTPTGECSSKSSWLPRLPAHLDFLHDWGFVLVLVYLSAGYFLVFRHLPAVNAVALASLQLAGLIQGDVVANRFPGTWPGV